MIGRGGANIARHCAAAHIFGYTIFNDWSARDLQFTFMEAGRYWHNLPLVANRSSDFL